ncbi:retrotransposon protein, putative, ty1-copia subclass [Tanacetum coccineum]
MKSYIDNLEHLGHPMTLGLAVSLVLIGLRKEFDGFVQNYNMHSLGKTVNELHAMLKLHEQTLPKNNAPALHAIQAGKVQKADLLKKKKNTASGAGGSGIFTIELNTFLNRSWIYDTGCGTHICNTTQGLRASSKLKSRALNFVIPRDGIFEIDLSNSYANESSIYTVSNKRAKLDLDSALLWHCRLGHISKKHIEKLQNDGLLNSTDLKAFEKCVPCMSGKMANTHQVERAKDLLGLIHTDVCGPFKIMSRQGASYFVTFTNDFSRYGYVYLLKHKHEVFETFKVFQKEVENQLVSERRNRTLLDMVRSMTSQTTLPKSFWDYALETAARILNMVPTKKSYNSRSKWSLEDLEIIQEEDTHPSIDTNLHHEEDNLEIVEPQSDINLIRRSTRTRRPTDRLCLYIDAEEHELGDLGEPANYKVALLDPDYDKWLNAMNVKMQSMKDNEVWDLVDC